MAGQPIERLGHHRIPFTHNGLTIIMPARFQKVAYCGRRCSACQIRGSEDFSRGNMDIGVDNQVPAFLRQNRCEFFPDPFGPGRLPMDKYRYIRAQPQADIGQLCNRQIKAP